ncbi:hypothetical protein HYC85_027881 [Camellia sinensis]|uniref:USP domain-containing protein n=1 Tax=Camellia sinensis TaxID=4442 RepID=A0A7J7FTJ7_CAMSI|nr:hypothetical protein HYC85_027881 [Camellia sinensis]
MRWAVLLPRFLVLRSSEEYVARARVVLRLVLDLRVAFPGSSELFVARAVWVFLRSIENFLARARVFCVWSLERPILRSSERVLYQRTAANNCFGLSVEDSRDCCRQCMMIRHGYGRWHAIVDDKDLKVQEVICQELNLPVVTLPIPGASQSQDGAHVVSAETPMNETKGTVVGNDLAVDVANRAPDAANRSQLFQDSLSLYHYREIQRRQVEFIKKKVLFLEKLLNTEYQKEVFGDTKANETPIEEPETEAKVLDIPSPCSMDIDSQTSNQLPQVINGVPKGLRIEDVLGRIAVSLLIRDKVKAALEKPGTPSFVDDIVSRFPGLKSGRFWKEHHDLLPLHTILNMDGEILVQLHWFLPVEPLILPNSQKRFFYPMRILWNYLIGTSEEFLHVGFLIVEIAALLMWFYNVLCTLGPLLPICWRKAIEKNADRMIGASFVNFKPKSKDPVKVDIPFHQLIFSRGYLILVVTLAMENKRMRMMCLDEFGEEKALHPSTQETSLIQHIFGGHLQSQVICSKCNNVSNQYENMMDLTVEIQGDATSLKECLDLFTVREWLHGDNMYKCDGCNEYVMAWKRLTVRRAPNILTIALKRFQSGREQTKEHKSKIKEPEAETASEARSRSEPVGMKTMPQNPQSAGKKPPRH